MTISSGGASGGRAASFRTSAPEGVTIIHAYAPDNSIKVEDVNDGSGFGGGFDWRGGNDQVQSGWTGWGGKSFVSNWFGFYVVCHSNSCRQHAKLQVRSLDITASESRSPSLTALGSNNLYYQGARWVRGTWPVNFSATDPSGVCAMLIAINGQPLYGPAAQRNSGLWHQCPDQTWPIDVQTANYGQGPIRLTLAAGNAAGVWAAPTATIHVDNQAPTIALSGPTDAPSSAGSQSVSASATAGPSGVAGIACSLDGGPPQWHPGSSTQVPVTGVGVHHLTCFSANNAIDATGNPGVSQLATYTLSIRQPTVQAIGFVRVADALRCRREPVKVLVPAAVVLVHRHGHLVRVRRPAHTRVVHERRCHVRIVRRKIATWTTLGGRRVEQIQVIKVAVPPHTVINTARRVRFGQGTKVSGVLLSTTGAPLAGQRVVVLTAPDDTLGAFTPAATAVTGSNGSWSAKLPPGPSRLVETLYGGDGLHEPSLSAQDHLIVPAKVKLLSVSPRHAPWGGTVRITGELLGGHLPAGGALVRLRIGHGSGYTTFGVQTHVGGSGRFDTEYQFGPGDSARSTRFWFQLATLPESSYPYAPAASARRYVVVGGRGG